MPGEIEGVGMAAWVLRVPLGAWLGWAGLSANRVRWGWNVPPDSKRAAVFIVSAQHPDPGRNGSLSLLPVNFFPPTVNRTLQEFALH